LYPECADFRGFGWVLPYQGGRIRVLGTDGAARARVEYLVDGDTGSKRRREWLPVATFPGLARHLGVVAKAAPVAPVAVAPPVGQVALFGGGQRANP
jgi:hypothetical protein